MKGKIRQISLVALASLFAVTACDETEDDAGGANSNLNENTDDDGDYDVTITFWHTFGKTIQDTLDRKIEEFEDLVYKNEGVKVHVVHTYRGNYDDILNNVTTGFSGGNVPTIAIAYPDHVADYLDLEEIPGSYVVNLDQYIDDDEVGFGKEAWLGDEDGIDDFIDAYIEEGQQFVQEGTYLIPLMKSTEVMFYNVNIVEPLLSSMASLDSSNEYHIDMSGQSVSEYLGSISWDQLIKIGEYSIAKDSNGDYIWNDSYAPSKRSEGSKFYPVYYDSDSNLFITKMIQNEIPYSSVNQETNVGSIDFEEGQARVDAEAMVTKLKNEYKAGILTTKGAVGEYGSNYFVDEQAIFSIGSSGGTGYQLPSSDTFEVGVCRVPGDKENPADNLYVCQGPSMTMLRNPGLSDEENDLRNLYAWKFMKYLTNVDTNVELCTYGSEGYSPVRESAYYTDEYQEYLVWGEEYAETAKIVTDLGNSYFTTAVFPGSAELRDQVGGIVTEVLLHDTNVSTAFDNAINQTKLKMSGSSSSSEDLEEE